MTNNRRPDTAAGARAAMAALYDPTWAALAEGALAEPDPHVPGVWKLETPRWRAVVYLAGYGGRADDDVEVEWLEG